MRYVNSIIRQEYIANVSKLNKKKHKEMDSLFGTHFFNYKDGAEKGYVQIPTSLCQPDHAIQCIQLVLPDKIEFCEKEFSLHVTLSDTIDESKSTSITGQKRPLEKDLFQLNIVYQ